MQKLSPTQHAHLKKKLMTVISFFAFPEGGQNLDSEPQKKNLAGKNVLDGPPTPGPGMAGIGSTSTTVGGAMGGAAVEGGETYRMGGGQGDKRGESRRWRSGFFGMVIRYGHADSGTLRKSRRVYVDRRSDFQKNNWKY